jgi:hypothetical protein
MAILSKQNNNADRLGVVIGDIINSWFHSIVSTEAVVLRTPIQENTRQVFCLPYLNVAPLPLHSYI